jgi:REP element-mobilizing transposase RayT
MAQSLARLWTHLVFSTKKRFPFLSDKDIRNDMHSYLAKVLRNHDCETYSLAALTITYTPYLHCQEIIQLPKC